MDTVTVKVIEVTESGQKKYVAANSCLSPCTTVYHPANAIDFSIESEMNLHRALGDIAVKGDEFWARSGIRSETLPEVVEFEIAAVEVSRVRGRDFHRTTYVEKQQ